MAKCTITTDGLARMMGINRRYATALLVWNKGHFVEGETTTSGGRGQRRYFERTAAEDFARCFKEKSLKTCARTYRTKRAKPEVKSVAAVVPTIETPHKSEDDEVLDIAVKIVANRQRVANMMLGLRKIKERITQAADEIIILEKLLGV
jgi:hypothetical protein